MEVLSAFESLATLTISDDHEDRDHVAFRFRSGSSDVRSQELRDYVEGSASFAGELDALFFNSATTDEEVAERGFEVLRGAVPVDIDNQLQAWAATPTDDAKTLVVEASEPWLADLPWEFLSPHLGGNLLVVRSAPVDDPIPPGLDKITVLLAGWSALETGEHLAGVRREVEDTPKSITDERMGMAPLSSPTFDQLKQAASDFAPHVIHLATANGFGQASPESAPKQADEPTGQSPTYLWLGPATDVAKQEARGYEATSQEPVELQRIADHDLIDFLQDLDTVRLIVVNTMANPPAAVAPLYRQLAVSLGAPVVGWAGNLDDHIAPDFAVFLYTRILEGFSLPEAVRAFLSQFGQSQWVTGALPVIWIPSQRWLDEAVMAEPVPGPETATEEPTATAAPTAPAVAPPAVTDQDPLPNPAPNTEPAPGPNTTPTELADVDLTTVTTSGVTIEFVPQESLFPSLMVNGQDAVKSLNLRSEQELDTPIQVNIVCDTGGQTSVYRHQESSLTKGPNNINLRGVGFPVLYELMHSNEPRIVNFEVSAWAGTTLLAQETRSVRWRARREWLDSKESYAYLSSFVLPMGGAIADLVRRAESVLAQIGGPRESFTGYHPDADRRMATAERQVKAIFQALRDWELTYIIPPGTPVWVHDPSTEHDDDEDTGERPANQQRTMVRAGQLIRFPSDIVDRRHATCHDLALLLAAAIEYVNLRPIIVVLAGHTLIGYWVDTDHYDQFWAGRVQGSTSLFGFQWNISGPELKQLIRTKDDDGNDQQPKVVMFETTLVTNPVATWGQAVKRGTRYVERQEIRAAIDVRRSRQAIQPLSFD